MIIRQVTTRLYRNRNNYSVFATANLSNLSPSIFKSNVNQQHQGVVLSTHFILPRRLAYTTKTNCVSTHDARKLRNNVVDEYPNQTQPDNTVTTLSFLQHIFNLSDPKKAESIMSKYPQFQFIPLANVVISYKFLLERGVTSDHLLEIPWLLAIDKKILEEKVENLMNELQIQEFQCAVSFIRLSTYRLSRISSFWKEELLHLEDQDFINPDTKQHAFNNRIEVLAFWLRCESYKVADMMRKTPALMSSPLQILETKLNLMLNNGVLAADIVRDPFIFTNLLSSIEAKLIMCKQRGLKTIKPWMLRCTPLAFETYVGRINREQLLLDGHKDTASFLSNSLGCTAIIAKEILMRVPSVKSASAIKLDEMIQFLVTRGFTKDHILEVPRILGHSVETVETRINELGSHGLTPPSLSVLCYTSKHYSTFLTKFYNDITK